MSGNFISNVVSGAVSGALTGAVPGAITGAVSGAVSGAGAAASTADPAAAAQKAKLSKIAHQFEAIFTRQMLAQAHKGSFGEAPSQAMNTFNSMQDSKFADISSAHDSLGIAKLLEKTLGARSASASQKGG